MVRLDALVLNVWAVQLFAAVDADNDGLVVETKFGSVRGNINSDGSRQFVSVPFAAPPVGNLRLRPPQEPAPWSGERDCTCNLCMTLPKCLQTSPLTGPKPLLIPPMGPGTEDCLYLHVYAPNPPPSKLVPVAIWLFGGGFQTGDAYFTGMYSGGQLAQKHNLVVIAPNYRLGALGFLAHELLAEEDKFNGTGNYGILDQQFAMRWVQDNVAAFGGDPSQVSLFGQSAGAFSIAVHMVSSGSKALFHRAIFESSNFEGDFFFQPLETAKAFGASWANNVGCDANSLSKPAFLQCLRSVKAEQFVSGTMFPSYPETRPLLYPVMPWGPVIDGTFLEGYPRDLVSKGKFHRVPVIIGTQHDEGTLFESAMALTTPGGSYPLGQESDFKALLEKFIESNQVDQALKLYPLDDYSGNCTGYWVEAHKRQCLLKWQANEVLRDYFFSCASRAMARTFERHGVPVWNYQFDYNLGGQGMYKNGLSVEIAKIGLGVDPGWGGLGTFHMAEIPFVFGSQRALTTKMFVANLAGFGWNSDHQRMSDTMQARWASMFHSGNPNQGRDFDWPQFDSKSNITVIFDLPSRLVHSLNADRCDFWDTVGYSSRSRREDSFTVSKIIV